MTGLRWVKHDCWGKAAEAWQLQWEEPPRGSLPGLAVVWMNDDDGWFVSVAGEHGLRVTSLEGGKELCCELLAEDARTAMNTARRLRRCLGLD